MKCPICKKRDKVSIGVGDGYSQDNRECGYCGAVWSYLDGDLVMISPCEE